MESVKMGRIPKKLKEQAIRARREHQRRYSQMDTTEVNKFYDNSLSDGDDDRSSSNQMTESIASQSSCYQRTVPTQQSTDDSPDVIIIPHGR